MTDGPAALRQFIDQSQGRVLAEAGGPPRPAADRPARSAPLDIVIPIFNNARLLGGCLDALLPTLADGDTVWLIDDASDEQGVSERMENFSRSWPATRVLRNPVNLGFVGTANRAFELTSRDLVLLNSDTEVSAGWLEQLQACLDRNPGAAIVCPVSDRATILSVLPPLERKARKSALAGVHGSTIGDVKLPTAVGFCMLLRREFLGEAGGFSELFAPGYGEENDLSMRALKRGWDILAADRACVLHHSGGSFGSRAIDLQAAHQQRLDRLWPEYGPLVQAWWRDNPLRARIEQLAGQDDARERIVHVLHRQYHVGGTERVARTLIRALGAAFRHTLLYPGATDGAWCDFEQRASDLCRELMLNRRWIRPGTLIAGNAADLTCPHSERALARVIQGSGARLVHFHHMLHWDSLLLPALARALGCRVVISVHDLWFNCPVHNQLEFSRRQPCGRSRARTDQRCAECLGAWSAGGLGQGSRARSVGDYVVARQQLIREMLQIADAVLVPSDFILDRLLQAYPLDAPDHVQVLPHGVSIPDSTVQPVPGAGRNIGYFGGDQELKGARLVLQMAAALADRDVTFRVFGRTKGFDTADLPANVELRGFYNPDDVSRAMAGLDLAVLPSHYEESFSMVASECWAHGVPVLSSTRGALGERVTPGVNGWLVPDMRPESWVRCLRKVLEGDTVDRCRAALSRHAVTSIDEAADHLQSLYRDLLEQPSIEAASVPAAEPQARFSHRREKLLGSTPCLERPAGSRCLGIVRDHWGTAAYRVRFPLLALAESGMCDGTRLHVVRDAGFDLAPVLGGSGARHLAIQPFLSDAGLQLMEFLHRESVFEVVLVVDDLWTDLPRDNPVRERMPDDVPGRLAYAVALSDALVLTTPELQNRLGISHPDAHVIANALPARFWAAAAAASPVKRGGRLRIGWAGAPQHAGDLAFLEPVMRATSDLADWVFLGMCPDPLRPLAAEVHDMVPFGQYPAALAGAGLDLAIAPLTDHPFNRCKSHLKTLEYGILGLPVIAADLAPYRQAPVTRVPADDAEAWTAAIRALLQDDAARAAQGARLREWVLGNHMMEHRLADWQAALGIRRDVDGTLSRPG